MDTIQGLQKYIFSIQNKYSSRYEYAYRQGLKAQQKINTQKHNPHCTKTEMDKFAEDLERWKKEAEKLSAQAKTEENKLVMQEKKDNGIGGTLNYFG